MCESSLVNSAEVFSSTSVLAHACTGPVSSAASSDMTQTPLRRSPARIERSTGAAPRQRGNKEKWTLSIGVTASTEAGIIAP